MKRMKQKERMGLCWICGLSRLCQFSFADIAQTLELIVNINLIVAIAFKYSELLAAGELDHVVAQILHIEVMLHLLGIEVCRMDARNGFIAGGHICARRVQRSRLCLVLWKG